MLLERRPPPCRPFLALSSPPPSPKSPTLPATPPATTPSLLSPPLPSPPLPNLRRLLQRRLPPRRPFSALSSSNRLLPPSKSCSLGCKMVGIKRNADASFVLREVEGSGSGGGVGEGGEVNGDHHVRGSREGQDIRIGGSKKAAAAAAEAPSASRSSSTNSSSRRRKGIPHRAPFSS